MTTSLSDRGVRRKSKLLEEKRIAVGICGGIAAVETIKLIRELRRHGAEVTAFLTPSAPQFVGELSVSWACGRPALLHTTADVDHLDDFDLVLIAPATLNTIAKGALGLSDNAVSLLIAGQIGRRAPLLFVPTMNARLREHPLYGDYVARLKSWGARFHEAPLEEERLKMPDPVELADAVAKWVGK